MIHECAHHLLFKRKSWNYLAAIAANFPHVLPSAISFSRYHIKHHSFQGIPELDGDLPYAWEARFFSRSIFHKSAWLLLYPIFQSIRIIRIKEIKPVDKWIALNFFLQLGFDVAVFLLIGPKAFCFLLLSFFFSVGLHPLGARWIQEHYMVNGSTQETYSYYGPMNVFAFNVGYHNEHHDFPSVPWNRLPQLRATAREYYDRLESHRSWSKLLLRFLTDKNVSLFSRTVRSNRGRVSLADESKPDLEANQGL
jgi:sphingolipid delta-4 desaturase